MSRKLNLVPVLLAIAAVFVFSGSAMAACLFRMPGGPILSCSTCSCGEMSDAGVGWSQCIDIFKVANPPKTRFDKLIRYSDTNVRLRFGDGTESPLASDASQKQFNEILSQPNAKERLRRFKPSAGFVSNDRLNELAKLLGVSVQENRKASEATKGQASPVKRASQ